MFSFLFSDRARLTAARTVLERLAGLLDLPVCVRLWDGSSVPLGSHADPNIALAIHSPGVLSSLLRRPTMDNLLRHYAAGRLAVEGTDIASFGDRVRVSGLRGRLRGLSLWWLCRQALPFLFHPADHAPVGYRFEDDRPAGREHNRELIQFHYDLGNDFYQLFLGSQMQYSCAYFRDWNNSLEQAQEDKLEMICRKLRLRPGERLLDVGCGWGGLICHAAQQYGVMAHGITLSQQQLEFVRDKIRALGLERRVTVELRDYHDLEGSYDKIASIGMFEHVGIANFPGYFRKLHGLLRDRGILLNHSIARTAKPSAGRFRKLQPFNRFIRKYIFPGSELDHIGHTLEVMETHRFEIHDVEGWREHYARTARLWCQRLAARRDEAERLVGLERYRLWAVYLAGVAFAFGDGSLRIFQVVASKRAGRGASGLPATREDLYRPYLSVEAEGEPSLAM
jgi:cyclopropane-fatty-acyl-phospholipid synthase